VVKEKLKSMHIIAGARPNFVKIGPLCAELDKYKNQYKYLVVHTGQHYDKLMSDAFFKDLDIPEPAVNLCVGSGTHAVQTANIMLKYEEYVLTNSFPSAIIVVGDVNSTLACALVGVKLKIPIIHLESGLRSFDNTMPEEINRKIVDAISDVLLAPSEMAASNLIKENIPSKKISIVGNIMIDSLRNYFNVFSNMSLYKDMGLTSKEYIVLTTHRPSNVDNQHNLTTIVDSALTLSESYTILFFLHPRTLVQLKQFNLYEKLEQYSNIILCNPLGYLEFMNIVYNANSIITDSGGVQEETSYLNIPCVTIRENTEWTDTLTMGTNRLVHLSKQSIIDSVKLQTFSQNYSSNPLCDGNVSKRCVEIINQWFNQHYEI
jgi:UDP-N-acetylglucosamine 2-epimerase (non-hydrolysing)